METFERPSTSYAQNFEDVRLWRALSSWPHRTYVDVGAAHPVRLSVTHLFYQAGWRGINIEPGPYFDMLAAQRLDDVNLNVVVTEERGDVPFFIHPVSPDLSSCSTAVSETKWNCVQRSSRRLADVVEEYMPGQSIGFLKIDVEGWEANVIRSHDWRRFRPAVVVVEAIDPVTHEPSHGHWESLLLEQQYAFAHDDGINRFYCIAEEPEILAALQRPISPLDGFTPCWWREHTTERVEQLEEEKRYYLRQVVTMDRQIKERDVVMEKLQDQLNRLAAGKADAERAAAVAQQERQAVLDSLPWKVGQFIAERFPLMMRLSPRMRASRLSCEAVPCDVRGVYARMTQTDTPLRTARHYPPSAAETSGSEVMDALQQVRMKGAASALSEEERQSLRESNPLADQHLESLRQMILRLDEVQASSSVTAVAESSLFLIDAAALQLQQPCGIQSHGVNVARELCRLLKQRNIPCAFLLHDDLPPLPAEYARWATVEWSSDERSSVAVFLRLAPFLRPESEIVMELFRTPQIEKWSVWLDAIALMYPGAFIAHPHEFWSHQLGIEQLVRCDRLLALSEISRREAIELVGDHVPIDVTGCCAASTAVPGGEACPVPFSNYVLVVGNCLPHKNVAVTVPAFAQKEGMTPSETGLVIAAHLNPDQQRLLGEMASECGLPPDRLLFVSNLSSRAFSRLMAKADVTMVPSLHEGFSLPVVESIQAGTPVLVSDIPAHRELLDEEDPFFVADDPLSLAMALQRIAGNEARALTQQRESLARHYSPARLADTLSRCVDERGDLVARSGVLPSAPVVPAPSAAGHPFSLCKFCEWEDFGHPRLNPVLRDLFEYELDRLGPSFPLGFESRKCWEVAMAILAFREYGLLNGEKSFLGIGAGNEPTIFHLTRFAEHVLATDLYLGEDWKESAQATMLTDPSWHWPFFWRPERLEVRHMNALHLDIEDQSFDGIFSSSSVEHFGGHEEVRRALAEMHRVLKPGGILSISSEYRIDGPSPGIPGVLMFDAQEIEQLFINEEQWEVLEPFLPHLSPHTLSQPTDHPRACQTILKLKDQVGALLHHHVRYDSYPHIVQQTPLHIFTSFHLALRKQTPSSPIE